MSHTTLSLAIRPYRADDFDDCLTVFRSNIPKYFAESELAEFASFLNCLNARYLVVEQSGIIVACGGSYVRDGVGRLCWGMVAQSKHRSSIGSTLLASRLNNLFSCEADVLEVCIDTSQFSSGFFERFGFKARGITSDGFGAGLDCVEMALSLEDWLKCPLRTPLS